MTVSATTSSNTGSADQYHKAQMHIRQADVPTLVNTAGAATYTAAQVLGGLICRDPAGSARTDVLPTAALLVGAMVDERVGDLIPVVIVNCADASETISITAGSGGALSSDVPAANFDIAQNVTKVAYIRITGIVAGSAAYVVYM